MLTVLKFGGELLEDGAAMRRAARGVAKVARTDQLVVVHGGGRAIDADLRARGLTPRFADGLRITDADTLSSVVGVLAGRINTAFVAALTVAGVRPVGLTGADGALGLAERTPPLSGASGETVDLGLVGTPVPSAPGGLLGDLLALGYVPVVASVGMSPDGDLLNVNADVLAAHLASALGADRLVVAGGTPGVLDGNGASIAHLTDVEAQRLMSKGTAHDGMVAKLQACVRAVEAGVGDVRIVSGRYDDLLEAPGTALGAGRDLDIVKGMTA